MAYLVCRATSPSRSRPDRHARAVTEVSLDRLAHCPANLGTVTHRHRDLIRLPVACPAAVAVVPVADREHQGGDHQS
jgi:hypothetical protein